jgi:hypothetical protein
VRAELVHEAGRPVAAMIHRVLTGTPAGSITALLWDVAWGKELLKGVRCPAGVPGTIALTVLPARSPGVGRATTSRAGGTA